MAVQVKICGLNSMAAVDAALAAGADFAGLVFHSRSPRHLALDQGAALAARLRGRSQIVALLCDPDDAQLHSVLKAVIPDFIQLHGQEIPARIAQVRALSGKPVIKALSVADAADFAQLPAMEDVADMILFDAKAPASATRPGGHGVSFDWQLLRTQTIRRPWFLAGGLNPENVSRAIQISSAGLVDVSSGVETSPGVKSPDLIHSFITAARQSGMVGASQ